MPCIENLLAYYFWKVDCLNQKLVEKRPKGLHQLDKWGKQHFKFSHLWFCSAGTYNFISLSHTQVTTKVLWWQIYWGCDSPFMATNSDQQQVKNDSETWDKIGSYVSNCTLYSTTKNWFVIGL